MTRSAKSPALNYTPDPKILGSSSGEEPSQRKLFGHTEFQTSTVARIARGSTFPRVLRVRGMSESNIFHSQVFSLPSFSLPSFSLPGFPLTTFSLPSFSLPSFSLQRFFTSKSNRSTRQWSTASNPPFQRVRRTRNVRRRGRRRETRHSLLPK